MLFALPGVCPAVLRGERLDPAGTGERRPHTQDDLTRSPSAVGKV